MSLCGDRLIVTDTGTRMERVLPDDAAVLDAYRTRFGVVLDEMPRFD